MNIEIITQWIFENSKLLICCGVGGIVLAVVIAVFLEKRKPWH